MQRKEQNEKQTGTYLKELPCRFNSAERGKHAPTKLQIIHALALP